MQIFIICYYVGTIIFFATRIEVYGEVYGDKLKHVSSPPIFQENVSLQRSCSDDVSRNHFKQPHRPPHLLKKCLFHLRRAETAFSNPVCFEVQYDISYYLFVHNALPHSCHIIDYFCTRKNIRRLKWSLKAPDMNLIEHCVGYFCKISYLTTDPSKKFLRTQNNFYART